MIWNLQNSIHLLNGFCADTQAFSYVTLSMLKLKELTLEINAPLKELIAVISTGKNYQTLQQHLTPDRRLYQLLGLHFRRIHLAFGVQGEPTKNSIYLETVFLGQENSHPVLRDTKMH